jgi:peptidylprolyl isomerase
MSELKLRDFPVGLRLGPMKPIRFLILTVLILFTVTACGQDTPDMPVDKRPVMTIVMDSGTIVIQLRPDRAPLTVAHIRELANSHFYDGLTIVRVAPGHVVQGGDPKFDGSGGSGQTIKAEFGNKLLHLRGSVGMARDEDPDSGDSQFYICLADRPHLNGKYTVFGQVVSGMEIADAMTPGTGPMGFIPDKDKQPKIVAVRVADPQ